MGKKCPATSWVMCIHKFCPHHGKNASPTSYIFNLFNLFFMQTVRQFGKCILEQVSNTRGLACGLKFLCSYGSSLFAILLGLRHAVRLVALSYIESLEHINM